MIDDRNDAERFATPLERLLADQVGAVLGVAGVSREDNFFRLGGDSVSGARLARELSDTLGVPVPMRTVFDHPVVAELAAAIDDAELTGPVAREAAELYDALRRDEAV